MKYSACLDMDIGNRRLKWRCGEVSGFSTQAELPQLEHSVSRVRISCVRGNEEELSQRCRERFKCTPEFARSSSELKGVMNGYDNPTQLGVDRWLAIVAAWNACKSNCIVVDAGTALTVDFVKTNGQHKGGFIVPGLSTMKEQLAQSTAGVQVQYLENPDTLEFGSNTRNAVHNGAVLMCVSMIDAVFNRHASEKPEVFLTGGDAEVIQQHLKFPSILKPSLVFEGLELALE
ncbi:MAG: type III pantothenate kinase [Gammaproteobacteria bacterium]|nr:type III pantothenate kinase [Gammaproteobacteria bacterium]